VTAVNQSTGTEQTASPEGVADGPYTRALGAFAAGLRFEDLPTEVVAHAKRCLLDTLGCALFGSTLEWSVILRDTLRQVAMPQGDGDQTSVVWGTPYRLGGVHAALANGSAAHGFELDDLHKEAILHPGSVVAPAIFASAELASGLQPVPPGAPVPGPVPVTGAGALVALVAGYEVGARVGMSVGSAHLLQGWHPTGTHGTLAAAAAASSALGLTAAQAQHALGIAGSQSAGLMASQFASMVKRFHAGRASESGLYAALLARNGYTGITNLFESEYGGYCTTFSPSHDLSRLTDGLGERWETLRVGFKPYSTNGSCHPTIDLLLELLASERFGAADVDSVEIHASSATVAHVGWLYEPDSVTTAQMNLPYISAVVLTDGEAFVDQFSQARIRDPELVALSRRVHVMADPEIDAKGGAYRHATRVEIHLRDGRIVGGRRDSARGSEAQPLTDEEVRHKYRRLAAKALDARAVARVEGLVDQLEELPDLSGLGEVLAAGAVGEER
jgi:2-methylcitrate dehydratase PrpD